MAMVLIHGCGTMMGVNEYFLGDEYKIGDDGLADHEADNKVYPGGWISDMPTL